MNNQISSQPNQRITPEPLKRATGRAVLFTGWVPSATKTSMTTLTGVLANNATDSRANGGIHSLNRLHQEDGARKRSRSACRAPSDRRFLAKLPMPTDLISEFESN